MKSKKISLEEDYEEKLKGTFNLPTQVFGVILYLSLIFLLCYCFLGASLSLAHYEFFSIINVGFIIFKIFIVSFFFLGLMEYIILLLKITYKRRLKNREIIKKEIIEEITKKVNYGRRK
jgi:hypothetical protein